MNDDRRAMGCGLGCLMTVAGAFSGGMIGVLIAKVVGSVRGCQPVEGLPACDWYIYAGAGWALGAVTLPLITRWRIRRGFAASENSTRNGDGGTS